MNSSVLTQARNEIESLHEFFCEWFGGNLAESEFEEQFVSRFSSEVLFIPPAGNFLGLDDLVPMLRAGYGSNPEFRIQIREVTIHRQFDGFILASYEEWQRNALSSQPPNNGRISTVLFAAGKQLKWHYVHETWLPEEVMKAGSYDF